MLELARDLELNAISCKKSVSGPDSSDTPQRSEEYSG